MVGAATRVLMNMICSNSSYIAQFFWGQTMQMHGKFEGFPFTSALFGLAI